MADKLIYETFASSKTLTFGLEEKGGWQTFPKSCVRGCYKRKHGMVQTCTKLVQMIELLTCWKRGWNNWITFQLSLRGSATCIRACCKILHRVQFLPYLTGWNRFTQNTHTHTQKRTLHWLFIRPLLYLTTSVFGVVRWIHTIHISPWTGKGLRAHPYGQVMTSTDQHNVNSLFRRTECAV
jgi:hypothetical protein